MQCVRIGLLAVLGLALVATPAQAGPLGNLVESLPSEDDDVPQDVDGIEALAEELRKEVLDLLGGESENGPDEWTEPLVRYAEELAQRVAEQEGCASADVKLNEGEPLIPPKVETGQSDDTRWYRINAGAVVISIEIDQHCVGGAKHQQSLPTPDP